MAEEEKINLPCYFKHNRQAGNILSEEFAFSLLYNNIAPDKVNLALESVNISRLPNIFLLIQIDDYQKESKRTAIEYEFAIKVRIMDVVRSCLTKCEMECVAANLTGTDKAVIFFSVDNTEYEKKLASISQDICKKVHLFTNYSISVCVSELCESLSSFPEKYEQACMTLNENFFLGKKVQTKVISNPKSIKATPQSNEIDCYIQKIYVAISKGNRVLFGRIIVNFFDALHENGCSREQTRLLVNDVISKMGDYTLFCGVKSKKHIAQLTLRSKATVLSCCYVDEICFVLIEYYEKLCEALEKSGERSADDLFRETVQRYIKDHFRERIYLDDIAMCCGYSKYYFCRQLKKCFGVGLSDCVNRYRVERAKELLCSSYLPIEEIVHEIGFSSANYFEIVFRKNVGMPPTVYRKTMRC